jgi:hypothetical protein
VKSTVNGAGPVVGTPVKFTIGNPGGFADTIPAMNAKHIITKNTVFVFIMV